MVYDVDVDSLLRCLIVVNVDLLVVIVISVVSILGMTRHFEDSLLKVIDDFIVVLILNFSVKLRSSMIFYLLILR